MRGRRSRPRTSEPLPAADVLERLLHRLGGEDRGREQRAFAGFQAAVDSRMRRLTRPEALRDGVLFVRAASAPLAHELTLLRGPLLERPARDLGPGIVTDLRTRVGHLGRDK